MVRAGEGNDAIDTTEEQHQPIHTNTLSVLSFTLDASLVVESSCIAQRILIASQKNSNPSSNLTQDHEIARILLEPQPREITEIPSPFRQTNTTPSLCSRCVRVSTTKHQESKQARESPNQPNEMKQRTEMEQQQKSHTNKRRRDYRGSSSTNSSTALR